MSLHIYILGTVFYLTIIILEPRIYIHIYHTSIARSLHFYIDNIPRGDSYPQIEDFWYEYMSEMSDEFVPKPCIKLSFESKKSLSVSWINFINLLWITTKDPKNALRNTLSQVIWEGMEVSQLQISNSNFKL